MVAYEEVLPDSPGPNGSKEEWLQYLRDAHGDIEDAKATLIFIFDDEDEQVTADDIETVTDEPPNATFT